MDIQIGVVGLDFNFKIGFRFSNFHFATRRAITSLVYIITFIFYNNNMHNVAYYVHIAILMCNILHIICFYFSLHNIYYHVVLYKYCIFFPRLLCKINIFFHRLLCKIKARKHNLFILLNSRNHDLLLNEYTPNHVLLCLYFTHF